IEKLGLLYRAAQSGAELVAVQERHLRGDIRRGIIKERSRIHHAVLELFVDLSMHLVGTRFGEYADVGAAVDSLPRIVHGGVHSNLLDRFGRRCWKSLADGVIDGAAGLDLTAAGEILARIQDKPVLSDLAGRVAVKQIVGADPVERKAVAGVPLPVREDGLVAQPGVRSSSTQKVRMNAWAQYCE